MSRLKNRSGFYHENCVFEDSSSRRSNFVIAPDWVSEEQNPAPDFDGRKYRPWPYEFKGARFWPDAAAPSEETNEAPDRSQSALDGPINLEADNAQLQSQQSMTSVAERPRTAFVLSDGFLETGLRYLTPFGRQEKRVPALSRYSYNPQQSCTVAPPIATVHAAVDLERHSNEPRYAYYYDHLSRTIPLPETIMPPEMTSSSQPAAEAVHLPYIERKPYMNFANGYHFRGFPVYTK